MADPRHALGLAAEDAAADWLMACGWRLVGRRWRLRGHGEVDIVALDPAEVLVAIEVRARRSSRTGAAILTVDERRVGRLRRSLAAFASSWRGRHRGLRVDLVTVEPIAPGRWRLRRLAALG